MVPVHTLMKFLANHISSFVLYVHKIFLIDAVKLIRVRLIRLKFILSECFMVHYCYELTSILLFSRNIAGSLSGIRNNIELVIFDVIESLLSARLVNHYRINMFTCLTGPFMFVILSSVINYANNSFYMPRRTSNYSFPSSMQRHIIGTFVTVFPISITHVFSLKFNTRHFRGSSIIPVHQ